MSRPRLIALLLALATLLVYLPVGTHQFVNYDDDEYITANPIVKSGITLAGIQWALTTWHASNWHPLTWVSHMVDCWLFGLNPAAHHFVSALFHAANAALLFILLLRLTGAMWPCAFIAALFAWHPLHVESVAWVAERKDVLSTFFALLALLSYAKYVRENDRRSYGCALIYFGLGLMAKPMLVTLPFVLLLLDYWPLGRFGEVKKLLREKLPFFLLTAASCVITFIVQRNEAVATLEKVPLILRLENLPVAYASYLAKMLWPSPLAVFYPLPAKISVVSLSVSVIVLLSISVAVWQTRKRSPYLIVGWLWFLGMLVPVIGLVQVGEQALADRYTYFSATGIFLGLTFGVVDLAKRFQLPKMILPAAAIAVLGACLALTNRQLGFWENSELLFRHALAVTADNDTARLNLGSALEAKGDLEGALVQYRATIRLNQKSYQAYSNLGKILLAQGKPGEALDYCLQSVQANPGRATLRNNLGIVLAELGRYDDALGEFANAAKLDSTYAPPRFQTGKVLLKQGRDAEALPHFQAALQIEPNNLAMLIFVARLLAADENAAARNGSQALALAVQANHLTPRPQPVALDTLAMAFAETGDFEQAVKWQQQAVSLADAAGQQEDITTMRQRLELYRNHQPWRESFSAANKP